MRRRLALWIAGLGLALGSAHPAPPSRAQTAAFELAGPGPLSMERCTVPGAGAARCGRYRVFEDRAGRAGRLLELAVVVLPATGADPRPDPVFFLAGGPGQAATDLAPAMESLLPGVRRTRDIVLVDQRGTGRSNGLRCPMESTADLLRSLALDIDRNQLRRCRNEMDADLRLYTTPLAMDDLEELRRALGYGPINLFGGSYGTRAAQVYLRRHPASVRSMILRGVTTTGSRLPLYFARDAQRSLDRLLGDCGASTSCARRYPELKSKLDLLLARLDAQPAAVTVAEPSGEESVVEITRSTLVGGLRLLLYATQLSRTIPLIVEQGLEGRFEVFLQTTLPLERQILSSLSMGMFLSVICAEDAPFIDLEAARREGAGTFIGDEPVRVVKKLCSEWPRGEVPAGYGELVRSDVAALLISGSDDPVTPPSWAEEVASRLPNSRHVVLPDTGHIPATPGCVGQLTVRFLEEPGEPLDFSCVRELRRPAFVGTE